MLFVEKPNNGQNDVQKGYTHTSACFYSKLHDNLAFCVPHFITHFTQSLSLFIGGMLNLWMNIKNAETMKLMKPVCLNYGL